MRKNILLLSSWLITLVLAILLIYNTNGDKDLIENTNTTNVNDSNNFLTMMLETEAGSGEYALSNSGEWLGDEYTFNSELSRCENGGELSWNGETNRVVMQSNTSDRCYVYFNVSSPTLAEYIISLYTTDGENDLYYHDGSGSYTNATQEAGDNSYRYSGVDPNNYVCFGSDASACSNDNLYRIIGVFGSEVKLIKATSYGSYSFDSNYDNTWNAGTKPDIYTTLNTTYYNSLSSEWQSLIADATWQVGGMSYSNGRAITKTVYTYEVGTSQTGYVETMKIGLMYVSDYGYAASPTYWTIVLSTSYYGTNNWLYLGSPERVISRRTDVTSTSFIISSSDYGAVNNDSGVHWVYAIRPCLYLNSNVPYISGDGSISNPFRVA